MKLEEWTDEHNLHYSSDQLEGLHVIGTCGTCEHWDYSGQKAGFCKKYPSAGVTQSQTPEYFGCIYWGIKV